MDVETVLLNDNRDESIYMMQPAELISQDQEQKKNVDEPCVYKRIIDKKVVFLVLYVDDILLIGNDVGMLSQVKGWLANQFQMKALGEVSYVLGIQLIRYHKNKLLAFSQASYINKVLVQFLMEYSKKVGSLIYAILCTGPDICFTVGVASKYESNPGLDHWVAVKTILKWLRRTRNYMPVYSGQDLIPLGYTNFDF
ncbi:hypothetical protein ACOSQ3_016982 [Xanthoceras sorbifolium]